MRLVLRGPTRKENLTPYSMLSPQFFKYLASRANAAARYIIQTLPDGFENIALRGNIQQALVRLGILNDGFRFSIHRK